MWDGSFHTPRKKRIWRNAVGREGETGSRNDCLVLHKFTTPDVPPHPWRKSVLHPAQVSSMPAAVLFWENAMCWQSKVCTWFGGTKVYVQEYRYSYVMTIYTLASILYIVFTIYFIRYLSRCVHVRMFLLHIYCCGEGIPGGKKERRTPGGRVAPPVCASWFTSIFRSFS